MKKYLISLEFKNFNDKRSENRQRRNSTHKMRLARRRKKESKLSKKKEDAKKDSNRREKIKAPKSFSFIKNPDDVCKFINHLEKVFSEKRSVFVDLSGVEVTDHTAVTLMMAALIRFRAEGISFNGNYPDNEDIKEFISRVVGTLYGKKFQKYDEYIIHRDDEFGVYTHANKKVDSDMTGNLVLEASKMVWGEKRRCPGVQSSIIELMHNTNNHADPEEEGKKHWWLSVNRKDDENTISYVFVDFGVGIIDSLNSKTNSNKWYKGWNNLKSIMSGDAELLNKILEGELHRTVTDLSYRGKGLAHIAKAEKRGNISNLCVISNRAYCNNGSGVVRNMDISFSGTLVYWEVNPNTHNFKEHYEYTDCA